MQFSVQIPPSSLEAGYSSSSWLQGITLKDIAKRTAGFSGADLENLMNESAILAARRNKSAVTMDEINDATDRVIAGLEGRPLNNNASKKLIAYHEAGDELFQPLCVHARLLDMQEGTDHNPYSEEKTKRIQQGSIDKSSDTNTFCPFEVLFRCEVMSSSDLCCLIMTRSTR